MIPRTFIRASRLASTSTAILRTPISIPCTKLNHSTSFSSSQIRFYAAPSPSKPVTKSSAPPRDEEIPHRLISLVDPISKALLPPALLRDLLNSLDRKRYFIIMVDPTKTPPVCKIMDKKEEFAKKRTPRAVPTTPITASGENNSTTTSSSSSTPTPTPAAPIIKAQSGPPKEVHLTWGVTAHDLGHKLAKAKEMLGKGHRLIVVMNNKKGAEVLDARGRAAVIENVAAVLEGHGKLAKPALNKGPQVMMEFKRDEGKS